jgi:hypothetical protein
MGILIGFVGMMRRTDFGGFESGRCAVCQMKLD